MTSQKMTTNRRNIMTTKIDDAIDTDELHELEGLIKEMKGEGFNVYKRSLPFEINEVVALNIPTFSEAALLVRAMKLTTKEVNNNGITKIIFYDILPNTVKVDDLLFNNEVMTTVGNSRRNVAMRYFDLGEIV